jgi:hypothetical protein
MFWEISLFWSLLAQKPLVQSLWCNWKVYREFAGVWREWITLCSAPLNWESSKYIFLKMLTAASRSSWLERSLTLMLSTRTHASPKRKIWRYSTCIGVKLKVAILSIHSWKFVLIACIVQEIIAYECTHVRAIEKSVIRAPHPRMWVPYSNHSVCPSVHRCIHLSIHNFLSRW